MRYRYPRNEYPQCKEVPKKCTCSLCRWFDPNPGKTLYKNKGAKSKGRRLGLYSDADLRSGHIKEKKPVLQQNSQRNTSGGKVQVVDSTEFRKCNDFHWILDCICWKALKLRGNKPRRTSTIPI